MSWEASCRTKAVTIREVHWLEPFDLEALKHQVKAEPGQAGGAPAAGGYVIDTTEGTFQAMVQTSTTFPILLLLWVPTDDRLFDMARKLGDAVNQSTARSSCPASTSRPILRLRRLPRCRERRRFSH